MTRNRFKKNVPDVDFDDPSVLTVIPAEVQGEQEEEREEKKGEAAVIDPPAAEKVPLIDMLEKKAEGKNFTLYLDLEVVAKLDEMATASGNSRSKVANTLLRKFLLEK